MRSTCFLILCCLFASTNVGAQDFAKIYVSVFDWRESISALTTDESGNVYVAGTFTDSIVFNQCTLYSPGVLQNGFVAKLDSNGNCIWSTQLIDSQAVYLRLTDMVLDNAHNVYVGGNYNSAFGVSGLSAPPTNNYSKDAFLMKLNANGAAEWIEGYGKPGNDEGFDLTIDASDHLSFSYKMKDTLNSTVDSIAIIHVSSDGTLQWQRTLSAVEASSSSIVEFRADLATLPNGDIVVGINDTSGVACGSGGAAELVVLSAATGNCVGSSYSPPVVAGSVDSSFFIHRVGSLPSGGIVVGGYLKGAVDFGGSAGVVSAAQNPSNRTMIIARYTSSLNCEWATEIGANIPDLHGLIGTPDGGVAGLISVHDIVIIGNDTLLGSDFPVNSSHGAFKLDGTGLPLSSHHFGGEGLIGMWHSPIAVDVDGRTYIGSVAMDTVSFGSLQVTPLSGTPNNKYTYLAATDPEFFGPNLPVATELVRTTESVILFPNPVQQSFELRLPASATHAVVELYDFQMRRLKQWSYVAGNSCDIGNLPAGMYWVRAANNAVNVTLPLVKL